jgi:hypothetical protein
MSYVVIDHHHDEAAGVYRLVIGQPIYDDVPIFEDGQQVLEERSDGAVVPRTEQVVVGHEDVRDYVFADDDERWHDAGGDRLDDEEVAAAQRELIQAALDEQARAAEAEADATERVRVLPGAGEAL